MWQTEHDGRETVQQGLKTDQTATSKAASGATLKVQITNIDSYMAAPTSVDCSLRLPYNIFEEPLKKVPVIRIFGATQSRQRICLHVHQVWPYLYVQHDGPHNLASVREFGYHLGLSLNHAINIALHTNGVVYVAAVLPVKGVPFYGYHAGYRPFFKILLTNPGVMSRASSLLCSGAIMNRKIGVYGSHLSYILQFLVDHNLYGMDWISVSQHLFRSPLPVSAPDTSLPPGFITDNSAADGYRWVPQGMPSYLVRPAPPEKASHCELEADVVSASIMNRLRVHERNIHHVFHEGTLGLHFGQLVHSLNIIWADENARRVEHGLEELQPKNSQDQSAIDESLPSSFVDQGTRSENTAGSSRWSNHWRMQSLLESALLADRRHILSKKSAANENQIPMDFITSDIDTQPSDSTLSFTATATNTVSMSVSATNNWLDTWPTCYQVDVDGNKLYHHSPDYVDRFYYISTQTSISSQLSGLVDDKVADRDAFCTDLVTETGSILNQTVIPSAVVVDMALIGTLSSNSDSFEIGEAVVGGNVDRDNDRETAHADTGDEHLLEGLGDLDDDWIEAEVQMAEDAHGRSVDRYLTHQVDGADDSDYVPPQSAIRRTSSRRKRRRVLVPLNLRSSSAASGSRSTTSADDGALSSSPGFSRADQVFRQTYTRRLRRIGGRATSEVGSAAAITSGHAHGELCGSSSASKSSRRIPKYSKQDICVYIDHVAGSILSQSDAKSQPAPQVALHTDIVDIASDFVVGEGCYISDCSQEYLDAHLSSDIVSPLAMSVSPPYDYSRFYTYSPVAPRTAMLLSSLKLHGVQEVATQQPMFSDPKDVPLKRNSYMGMPIKVQSSASECLDLFNPASCASTLQIFNVNRLREARDAQLARRQEMWSPAAMHHTNSSVVDCSRTNAALAGWRSGWWVFAKCPPGIQANGCSYDHSIERPSCAGSVAPTPAKRRQRDQTDIKWGAVLGTMPSPTPVSTIQTFKNTAAHQQCISDGTAILSQVSLEIIPSCRANMAPDPKIDSMVCAVACFLSDTSPADCGQKLELRTVVWTCVASMRLSRLGLSLDTQQIHCDDELTLINKLILWIRELDPDILCGYEIHSGSWGYVIDRAEHAYGIQLADEISRVRPKPQYRNPAGNGTSTSDSNSWGYRKSAAISVVGRHTINIWRLMRSEFSLTSYTFENIVRHVLGETSPHYSLDRIASWLENGSAVMRIRGLRYIVYRAKASIRILDRTGVITRAAELAKVIGIDFNAVLTRGSQFRVESLMARIAHPEQFILPSPSREQVAQQRAAECLPLVLEPQSSYYTDPVVVLDFQSLYPSVMIAYNYCYSTCLGSLEDIAAGPEAAGTHDHSRHRLGVSSLDLPPGLLNALKEHITVSPNGVAFVKPSVRRGLLGRMLQELLESRIVIRDAMKRWGSDNAVLCKKLDAWQLGLKLIANVTYGYAGASFSGRMPCVDIADAIVQSGRETLESAIRFIHSKHAQWGARVVYGDTDSMFVHLSGQSRESAFRIGQEIAEAITRMNPAPIKLKFEKVYQPCVLLSKKRYAGWMFTSPEQTEPLLDAKGLELVRRDGCLVTQRVLEGTMDVLFRTNDLSLVKSYVTGEITRIMRGELSLQEFIIAKEVRLGTYSGRVLPAHAKVAVDGMEENLRAEPQYGERVPYVVISDGRSSRLTDQVVRPQLLLQNPDMRLDYRYYVDKQVTPALDRLLSLVGVDVRAWIAGMPRRLKGSIYDAVVDIHSDSDSDSSGSADGHEVDPEQGRISIRGPVAGVYSMRQNRRTLDHFYSRYTCILCKQAVALQSHSRSIKSVNTKEPKICDECSTDKAALAATIGVIQADISRELRSILNRCVECVGESRAHALRAADTCDSLDCPTMFRRITVGRRHAVWSRVSSHHDGIGVSINKGKSGAPESSLVW